MTVGGGGGGGAVAVLFAAAVLGRGVVAVVAAAVVVVGGVLDGGQAGRVEPLLAEAALDHVALRLRLARAVVGLALHVDHLLLHIPNVPSATTTTV